LGTAVPALAAAATGCNGGKPASNEAARVARGKMLVSIGGYNGCHAPMQ